MSSAPQDSPYVPEPKRAELEHPVLPAIERRWSPCLFDGRPVPTPLLRQSLEAARWAASSYNEQPWWFIVASRENVSHFGKALGCLVEFNQGWAKSAGGLIFALSHETFRHSGQPNRVHQYDLGQAVAQLSIQATALGLAVHQMAGLNPSRVRAEYRLPEWVIPQTALAIGYAAPTTEDSDRSLADRDAAPRGRKPQREFVFSGVWGEPWT
jgi:nitroreductase